MPIKDTFLAGILAHVPEADRGKAEAAIEGLEKDGLRQADYSRLANEAAASKAKFDGLYDANTKWYESRQADLAELDALREKVKTEPVVVEKPVVAELPKDLITKSELEKILDQTERGAVGFIAEANALSMQHYKEFGEILNITELLADKRVQQLGLKGVYTDRFKDQLKAKADAAQTARDEAIRKEGYEKARTELASAQHPYPVVGNEPSALDAIEAARAGKTPEIATVDTMAAEYARLSGARSNASA